MMHMKNKKELVIWLIAAVVLFCLLMVRCGGEMRGYVFIGAAVGFVLCRITVSKWIMAVADAVLRRCRAIWRWLRVHIYRPASRLLHRLSGLISRVERAIFRRISRAIAGKIKKFLENRKKSLQNEEHMSYNQNTTD